MLASVARTASIIVICGWLAGVPTGASADAEGCGANYTSTFELIQHEIFDKHGCTSATCHGAAAIGGLDLRADPYDRLIDAAVTTVPTETYPHLRRVVPGRKDLSLLWVNLASATLPELWTAPLRPMPLSLPPLSFDELEVIRLWIEHGAPRAGVVPGTGELVDACLPPARPLRTEPLAPPPAGLGVQLRAPHQVLPPSSEREVCFVTYYDFTGQVPPGSLSPDGSMVRLKRVEGRQDPLSHHLVAIAYKGDTPIGDPRWGAFTCTLGPRAGEPCDPTLADACGSGGTCGSEPRNSLACIGFGPGDADIGTGEETLFNTMGSVVSGVDGVYDEIPIKSIVVWNSHAFNLHDEPADLDVWINFEFAAPDEQVRRLDRFVDITAIAKMQVAAYGVDEVCHHHVVPPGMQLLDLTSHVHQRGRRFRVFAGAFACQGGPGAGQACSPFEADDALPLRDPCAGAPCTSVVPPRAGDCSGDLAVTVDELVTGVGIAIAERPVTACPRFDADGDGAVAITELIAAVGAALAPALRDPADSLLYVNLTYADPLVLSLNPPLRLGGEHSTAAERTLTYCALYDNGFTDPEAVKRRSRVPSNGTPCPPTHCAEGRVGAPCAGATARARDRSCDSAEGAGDGFCDACTVGFGVTTDDEMFVLVGSQVPE